MFSKFGIYLIWILLFSVQIVAAATPESVGLHLSFEQRLAVTYGLLAQGEPKEKQDELLSRAKSYFSKSALQGIETVHVENFQQFLKGFKGNWPDTHSVSLDVDIIETRGPQPIKVFKAKSPRIQRQIDRYLQWQQDKLVEIALPEDKGSKIAEVLKHTKLEPIHLLATTLAVGIAEKMVLQQAEVMISNKLSQFESVGEKIAQADLGKNMDAVTKILMQTILSEYFARLGPSSKKLIASSFLGGDLFADDLKKFEIMVQNSGPMFQKFLQIKAKDKSLNEKLREVFAKLENAVRKVPWLQVSDIYNEELPNYDFVYFEKEALAVGTMAQVHRAKIRFNGATVPVVARFIKPGIELRLEEDKRILFEVAKILDGNAEFRKTGMPKVTPVFEFVAITVEEELSVENTTERQKTGAIAYSKKALVKMPGYKNYIQFHVPLIYPSKEKNSKFMVQEMVFGAKLEKEVDKYKQLPDLERIIIEEMAKVWCYELLFGSGFYNSDLHQGNFMVKFTEPQIQVNILDFGMGGTISKDTQRRMMVLGAGIELVDPELIARGYWALSVKEENILNEQQFKTLVEARAKAVKGTPEATSLERWTAWAMDSGITLSFEFISLNRGVITVNTLLENVGSRLTVTSLMKIIGMHHPLIVYKRLALEEKLSHETLVKLGWKEVIKRVGFSSKPILPSSVESSPSSGHCEAVFK